ncbi:hypothetical protein, partial [Petrimonas sulfuriphila]|uniref:hypothetical protein n=1 Tax=Petrimonas sulfuriphila TaxID=285070 RepID=UPI003EBEE25D
MSAKIKTVYTLPDSVLINETTTDEHGEFAFTNLQSVNKMLKFSVDGYKEISFRALPEQNVKLCLFHPKSIPVFQSKSIPFKINLQTCFVSIAI